MKIKNEAKIGILVLISLAMLIWGISFLKGKSTLTHTKTFYAVYDKVDGLKPSGQVFINGLKVGQVDDIELMQGKSNRLLVTFYVENEYKIPRNTIAKLYNVDFFGSKAINLILGNSTEYYSGNDTLNSQLETEMSQVMMEVKNKAEHLLTTIDSTLQTTLNKKTIAALQSTVSNLDVMTGSLKTSLAQGGEMNEMVQNLNSILDNIKKHNEQITGIIKNLDNVSDSIAKSELKSAIHNSNTAIKELALMLNKLNSGEGTAGKLMKNDSLYTNLKNVSQSMDLLLKDLKDHPKRYVHFSMFGKKDK